MRARKLFLQISMLHTQELFILSPTLCNTYPHELRKFTF